MKVIKLFRYDKKKMKLWLYLINCELNLENKVKRIVMYFRKIYETYDFLHEWYVWAYELTILRVF